MLGIFFFETMIKITAIVLLLSVCLNAAAQQANLYIINTIKQYDSLIKNNSNNALIDVKKLGIKSVYLDLKYNTKDNFTKTKLYQKATTSYLRQPAAQAFKKVCDSLAKKDLYIKIWDAYRPYNATVAMWDLIQDERYVANPKTGSGHNKGLSIDITLVDEKGIALDMGTAFDNFTDTAHHDFKELTPKVLHNRAILKNIMQYYGFAALETEWWHYSYKATVANVIFNLSFLELGKKRKLKK
jgi:zinc D-Ala-D-Ala dipeptidase